MKPGIASWRMVTTPDSASTSRTTPTRGYDLVEGLGPSAGPRRRRAGAFPPQPAPATRARPRARFLRTATGGGTRGIIVSSHDPRVQAGSKGERAGASEGHQKGNESSRGLAESSVRNPARRSTTISVRASPLRRGGGAGVARPRVGRQEVPGAGDLDPAPVDGLEPGRGHGRRRRPGPARRGRGNGPAPCSSPSRRRGRPGPRRDRPVAVGGDLVPVAEEQMDRGRPGAARGGPISGRCRRARSAGRTCGSRARRASRPGR